MQVQGKVVDEICVITMSGRIDSQAAQESKERLLDLIELDHDVLLDMTQVDYLSSAGIRLLLLAYRKVEAGDNRIVVVGLSERLCDVLSLTGFLQFFQMAETANAGLALLHQTESTI